MFQAFYILEDNKIKYKIGSYKIFQKNEWYPIFLIKYINQQNHILKQKKWVNIYQIS